MIKESKTRKEICDTLLIKYTTDRTTLENDYQDFIELLSYNHLIERHEEKDA